ncbi:MAG: phenylalanine--tRNA ligase subunit alpha, partial [candidate division KSB1 bacterium]
MHQRLNELAVSAKSDLSQAQSRDAVEALRVRYLGKKGDLAAVLG